MAAAGITQIALLWQEDLSASLLVIAAVGFAYLLVALGLMGRSRLSLFLGIVLTLVCTAVLMQASARLSAMTTILTLVNPSIAVCCALALYRSWAH